MDDVSPVLEFLREKIGLNPESVGTASVEKAVRETIRTSGTNSVADYISLLNGSAAELKKLVESVVVSETSFFRNRIPFFTLQNYLKQFFLHKKPGKPLRVLCLPCSTGEEAYSIAMVLLDLKLPPGQFLIYAADISDHVLQIAKAGRYSPYSFRGEDLNFRTQYFSAEPDGHYLLKQEVRDVVHFEQHNILDENFLFGHQPYDIIFCRNLLIYFDDETKEKAINALSRHLADDGVLFVGHAEGAKIPQLGYAGLDYPMSFAFAKRKHAEVVNHALNINNPIKKYSPSSAAFAAVLPAPVIDARKIPPAVNKPPKNPKIQGTVKATVSDAITAARQLSDAGEFNGAVAICEKLLAEGVESAEVYYLLGQAAGASGNSLMAEEYLKKAIYLNADFYEALIYLSVLFERMGNAEKAASFSKRAQRVKGRKHES
ncbi:MAG: CheR family methyltransferase [Pseudomonadota bacterium]